MRVRSRAGRLGFLRSSAARPSSRRPAAVAPLGSARADAGADGAPGPGRARRGRPRIATGPRLVLLYAPCTVSKTHLSPYTPSVPYTPSFARIAAEGVTFEAHRTEAGSSGIAYASLFSSTQVDRHGVAAHPAPLSDDLYVIAEAFRDAGYTTYYWNHHGMASARFDYAQGVDPRRVIEDELLDGKGEKFRRLLGALRALPTLRAFVLANLATTHGPYYAAPLP